MIIVLFAFSLCFQPLQGEVLPESVFAILTQKAGVAKGLAHNHFVYASRFQAQFETDLADLKQTRLNVQFPVTDLVVDDHQTSVKWFPVLKLMGLLEEPFEAQSEGNLKKIRKSMLGKRQLNAKIHKTISAQILEIRKEKTEIGNRSFAYALDVEVEIVGKKIRAVFPAELQVQADIFSLESLGRLTFSQFGIEPYSAMLGAVSNKDEFFVYVNLKARYGNRD